MKKIVDPFGKKGPSYRWALFPFLVLLLAACQKEVELDLDEQTEPDLVVESFLTDSAASAQAVRLSTTRPYYETGATPAISGVPVQVSVGGQDWTFMENTDPDSAGYYMAPPGFSLSRGDSCELELKWKGDTYRSGSAVDTVPEIDSLGLRIDPFQFIGPGNNEVEDTTINVVAHFTELQGPGDHYYFDLYRNGELLSQKASEKSVLDDEDLKKEISLAVQSFELSEVAAGDTLVLRVLTVDRICDEFYEVFNEQTGDQGGPFGGAPPADLPTNISNGGRGLFQASGESRSAFVINAEDLDDLADG